MSTATFTDLLRKPKEVLAHIDEGQVRITRRDGDDLVILRGSDLNALEEGVSFSSQLTRALRRNESMERALADLFAWTTEFTPNELSQYAADIERLLFASSELGHFGELLRVQREWRETAAAYAMGMRSEPAEVLEHPIRVERP